jgi:hypothetical protein
MGEDGRARLSLWEGGGMGEKPWGAPQAETKLFLNREERGVHMCAGRGGGRGVCVCVCEVTAPLL